MSTIANPIPQRGHRSRAPIVRGRAITFGFVPGLDGLRAVAVLGVMLYHGGAPFLGGGYLTIDVFFVLSGFLITTLLLGEWAKRITIKLGQFWTRRARRLLPALLVMLLGVAIYVKVFAAPGEYANLRLDSLSTLFYVANWHFIFAGSNYFDLAAQKSPLAHMWSLSIEEQFYIVWPPVVLVMLRIGNRLRPTRRLWPLLAVAVGGALASAVEMRLRFYGGASINRLYEGTDTRSQDILIGAALAIGMAIWARQRRALPQEVPPGPIGRFGRIHPAAGTAGVIPPRPRRRDLHRRRGPSIRPIAAWEIAGRPARVVVQFLCWSVVAGIAYLWSHLPTQSGSVASGQNAFLFEGGYFLFAIAVAVVIFGIVTAQAAALSRAFGNVVFRYVGKVSYGTYLWHFPLFALLTGARMHLYGTPLLAVRIAITLMVATGSFYLVEEPIRRGRMRSLSEWRAWLMTSGAFLGVVAVTVVATLPSAAEAAGALRVTGAQYSGPPVKVLVLGDSVAWRLGFAMQQSQLQDTYDVSIVNDAIVGCGLVRSTEYVAHGVVDSVTPPCNSGSPASMQWPTLWAGDLAEFHPSVVVVLAGRWEVMDRLIGGRWLHIGDPAFDAALRGALEQAVQVGTSSGALMELMTSPCFASGEQNNGLPWPEDSTARLDAYNQQVRQVAAEHPTTVRLVDFDSMLCPGGRFATSLDGVQLRDGDGVHIVPTAAAGAWLDQHVLPGAVAVGRLQMAGANLVSPATSTTPPPPAPPVTATAAHAPVVGGARRSP